MSLFKSKPSWSKAVKTSESEADLFQRIGKAHDKRTSRSKRGHDSSKTSPEKTHAGERSVKRQRINEDEDDGEDIDDADADDDDDDGSEDVDDEEEEQEGDVHEIHGDDRAGAQKVQEKGHVELNSNGKVRSTTQHQVEEFRGPPTAATPPSLDEGARPENPLQMEHQSRIKENQKTKAHRKVLQESESIRTTRGRSAQNPSDSLEVSVDDIIEIAKPPPAVHESSDEDEEFPELARQARERATQLRLEKEQVAASSRVSPHGSQSAWLSGTPDTQTHAPARASSQQASVPEPVLEILITSKIPNTAPLVVKRKLNQRLKDVRLAWIDRQGLGYKADDIFLTWRGTKLYDVTTCKSLGVGVDAEGNAITEGNLLEETDGRFQVEAMTQKILEAYREAKRDGARRTTADNEPDLQEVDGPTRQAPVSESQLKIILRAKGQADFKIIVKPSYVISKILDSYRRHYAIEPGKQLLLHFDGEQLDPSQRLRDTEVSDMDTLDVYIK